MHATAAAAITQELVIACFIQALHIASKHRRKQHRVPREKDRLDLMFSFKLSAQRLQMNSGAREHAAQLSLKGLNSERIEQTVLGSQNEGLFQRS